MRRDAGLYVETTRVMEAPIASALFTPGRTKRIDISDLHVSLAHSEDDSLRETTREMGIMGHWHVLGIRRRRGGRWLPPEPPSAALSGIWNVFSWISKGGGLRLSARPSN